MDGAGQPNLRITIIAADGLYKRDVFRMYAHVTTARPGRSHKSCRISGPLRRGHDQWRADAHHECHQEDAEPVLE
ncbi:E3 ubiquitin-protein ligase [Pyrenophora tritici-repentis]|nr:E3 ubiquitin-protein ligase [Pyrenophora tritici-repentis]